MRKHAIPVLVALWLAVLVAAARVDLSARSARAGNGDANNPAQAVDSGYAPDTNFQAFRSSVSAIDTPTTTIVLATPAFQVQGRTTMLLGARFSASPATVTFRPAYVWRHPSATSDTDVTVRAFSWKNTTWAVPWTNTTYNVASNVIKGWGAPVTLTAGTTQTEGSYYPATAGDIYLDTERAVTMRIVVVTAPSSGTVSFWTGS